MSRKFNVAVVGATGAVGETMLAILAERGFPVGQVYALAGEKSWGREISFGNRTLRCERLSEFDFSGVDIALFSAGGDVSVEYAPKAAAAGAVVVDNSSAFRYDDAVPLVVAEVNPEHLNHYRNKGIVANPNCSTMQMMVAIAPIHRAFGISRVNVATYQSVSGAGRKGLDELARQTADLLNAREVESQAFSRRIAFNAIPQIDRFEDNGYTREEMKMVWETQKILDAPDLGVNATAVRIPVFYGHAEAVHLETIEPASPDEIRALLAAAPGLEVLDNPAEQEFPTPAEDAAGKDPVFVGRIRRDLSHERGISMWVVADNVRKGAALNAVQIAELLVNHHL